MSPKNTPPDLTSLEEERMREVLLALELLFDREDATEIILLNCLYDIATANLIEQKLSFRPLRKGVKPIARMSKPAFRFLALRWLKKNCPQLIADFLYSKVSFQASELQSQEKPEVLEIQAGALAKVEAQSQEIERLRSRVRWLTGFSIATIATLGGTAIWLGYRLDPFPLQPMQPVERSVSESAVP